MSLLREDLTELYDNAGEQLFRCALAVTTSGDLAEDAVHDAFIKAFRIAKKPDNLKAYMFRAVRNAAVDIVRRQARVVQTTSDRLFEISEQVDGLSKHGLDIDSVSQALKSLSDDERETILEHLVAGLTFREIAELRQRPSGTIATWYRRGIEKLRSKMSKQDE